MIEETTGRIARKPPGHTRKLLESGTMTTNFGSSHFEAIGEFEERLKKKDDQNQWLIQDDDGNNDDPSACTNGHQLMTSHTKAPSYFSFFLSFFFFRGSYRL
jgi:hypothetical protein